jgi:hypothetical protein
MRTIVNAAGVLGAAVLAACSSQPQLADSSPQNPTAVFETRFSSTGIAGAFPFETTEKHYVRSGMRRDEHSGKGTGTFSGFLVTRLMGQGDTTIARLDRNVRWTLDQEKKTYTECPVHGCPRPPREEKPAQPEARREEPKQKTEEGCVMRIASSKFDVKPTGAKQSLNGFDAEQYRMAWVLRLQDRKKRTTTSTVNVDLWTTAPNASMRQAMETEAAFAKAFTASSPRAAAPRRGEAQVVPADMVRMMTAYLHSLSAADRASLQRAANELNKVKGQPIRTQIDWLLEGNACGAAEEQQQRQAQPSARSMLGGLGSLVGKKEEKPETAPVVSFTMEVKQLGVVPAHDSLFDVPAGYKRVTQ